MLCNLEIELIVRNALSDFHKSMFNHILHERTKHLPFLDISVEEMQEKHDKILRKIQANAKSENLKSYINDIMKQRKNRQWN